MSTTNINIFVSHKINVLLKCILMACMTILAKLFQLQPQQSNNKRTHISHTGHQSNQRGFGYL